ncbi:MAG: tyrosine-type recombinase/integrase [Pleurocapsa sp.]
MKAYTIYLKQTGQSESTIGRTLKQVKSYLHWLSIEDVTPSEASYETVLKYLLCCRERGLSDATLRNYLQWIRSFYDFLESQERIQTNPIKYLKLRRRSPSIERSHLLLSVLPQADLQQAHHILSANRRVLLRNKVLLGLGVYQGLAPSEEEVIRCKDLDLQRGQILIRGTHRYKGRSLSLAAPQILQLSELCKDKSGEDYLIKYKSKYHGVNARTNLFMQLKVELKRNDVDVQIENLAHIRRSVIVGWLKQYSIRKVQYLAGHHRISSTERYQTTDLEALHKALSTYHPLREIPTDK